jgi:Ni/Co efflux regulator RcnB
MKRMLTAALAFTLLAGGAANAQSWQNERRDDRREYRDDRREDRRDYRDERRSDNRDWRDDRRDDRRDYRDDRRSDNRDWRDDRRDDRRFGQRDRSGRYYYGEYRRPQGWNNRAWRRGERLPPAYRSSGYYVSDYGRYGLRAPPRGHAWVRVNNDVVLTALATGLILEIVNDRFYY